MNITFLKLDAYFTNDEILSTNMVLPQNGIFLNMCETLTHKGTTADSTIYYIAI